MSEEELLTDDEIEIRLARLEGWAREGEEIVKTYERDSFPTAISLVVRIGFLAEAADHHPDIDIRYRRVRIALSTHSAGGLTGKDFAVAGRLDEAAR